MPSCAAFGCNHRSSKPHKSTRENKKEIAPKMTFHKFPKNPERRNAWAKAVHRANWIPNKNSVLCSAHFTEEAFDRTSLSCVRIRDTAVPSIFSALPPHFQHVQNPGESSSRSAIPELSALENVNTMDVDTVPSTSSALPDYPVSSMPAVSSTVLASRKSISRTSFSPRMRRSMSSIEILLRQKLKHIKLQYQKKIKFLLQSERRHVKIIESLKNVITALRKQKCNQ